MKTMTYFVVDTNYLRIDFPPRLQRSTPDEQFVLTDTTVLETMKPVYWETVAQNSFGSFAPHCNKIVVANAPSELMRKEIASRNPITSVSRIINLNRTSGFQNLVAEISSGVHGQKLAYAKSQISAAQADLANQQLNHAQNEQSLQMAVADIKNAFRLREYRRVADTDQKEMLRLYGVKNLSRVATEVTLTKEGVEVGVAKQMSAVDSFCLRQTIGLYCLGWKWALNGSLPQCPKKINNELMDLDQSVIATYCAGILTGEPSVDALREDILRVLNS